MAAPSSSDQPVTKSELNNLLTDKATDAIYSNWRITWGDDASVLQDEDVITVTIAEGNPTQHTIWSLVSIKEPDSEQPPFKLRSTSAASLPQEFLDKHLFKGLPEHLNAASHEIHVLISTLSGTGLSPSFFDNVLHYVLGAIGLKELDYKIIRTSSAESVAEFARSVLLPRAGEGKKQTVLMLSGDGGVVDTINGILDSEDRPRYIPSMIVQIPLLTSSITQRISTAYVLSVSSWNWQCLVSLSPQILSSPIHIHTGLSDTSPWYTSSLTYIPGKILPRCTLPVG